MSVRVDLLPKPPYSLPTLVVDVFHGSLVGRLLDGGAGEVWVTKSARAARIVAGGDKLLLGEQEGLPPEGFHYGTSLKALESLDVRGKSFVLFSPTLGEALTEQPSGTLLAYFRNSRAVLQRAAAQDVRTLVATPQAKLEPSLSNTVAAGFLAKRLHQALGKWGELQEGARLATTLLKSFPDPQEALFQSEAGQQLFRSGRTEDLALASLTSVEETVPVLSGIRVLEAARHGLSKDRGAFCLKASG